MNKRGEQQSIYYTEDECEYPLMVPVLWAKDANKVCFLLNAALSRQKFRHTGRVWTNFRIIEVEPELSGEAWLARRSRGKTDVEKLTDRAVRASHIEAVCEILNKYATTEEYFALYTSCSPMRLKPDKIEISGKLNLDKSYEQLRDIGRFLTTIS